jgi:hypothetical protein
MDREAAVFYAFESTKFEIRNHSSFDTTVVNYLGVSAIIGDAR